MQTVFIPLLPTARSDADLSCLGKGYPVAGEGRTARLLAWGLGIIQHGLNQNIMNTDAPRV